MPTVPTPVTQGVAPLGDVQRASGAQNFQNIQQVDMSFGARQLGQLGQVLGDSAKILQGRTNNRLLLEMQAEGNALEEELFNPETGVRTRLQGDAIGATEEIEARLAEFNERWAASNGLSASGRDSAAKYLEAHRTRLTSTVASHETTQSIQYENTLITANVTSQIERVALHTDDDTWDAAVANITTSTDRQIDLLGLEADVAGEDGETPRNTALREAMTQAVVSRAAALADNGDAAGALGFLESEQENMSQDAYRKAKNAIETIATEERIEGVTNEAVRLAMVSRGLLEQQATTALERGNIDLGSMGPNRPNPPNARIQNALSDAVFDVLGDGATARITSGQEGDLPQYGSDRHGTGDAADVQFLDKDGTPIAIQSAEGQAIIAHLEGAGILGLGAGEEYMGPNTLHADFVREGRWGEYMVADNGSIQSGSSSSSSTTIRLPQGEAPEVDMMSNGMDFILNSGLDASDMASAMNDYNNVFAGIERDRAFQSAALQNSITERAITAYEADENTSINDILSTNERIALGPDLGAFMSKLENMRTGMDNTDFNWFQENAENPATFAEGWFAEDEKDREIFRADARANLSRDQLALSTANAQTYVTDIQTAVNEGAPTYETISKITNSPTFRNAILGNGGGQPEDAEEATLLANAVSMVTKLSNESYANRVENNDPRPFDAGDVWEITETMREEVGNFDANLGDASTLGRAILTADAHFDNDVTKVIDQMLDSDGLLIGGLPIDPQIVENVAARFEKSGSYMPSQFIWEVYKQASASDSTHFLPTNLLGGAGPELGPEPTPDGGVASDAIRGTGVPADDVYMSEVYGDKQATQEYMESVYGVPSIPEPARVDAAVDVVAPINTAPPARPEQGEPDDDYVGFLGDLRRPPVVNNTDWLTTGVAQRIDLIFDGETVSPEQFVTILERSQPDIKYTGEEIGFMYDNYLTMTGKR